jgi:hypothetical protein
VTGDEATMLARPADADTKGRSAIDGPSRYGRYRVLDRLGEGGMGAVYLVHDEVLEREVALKSIRIPPGSTSELRSMLIERFLREGKALAHLSHPHVVRVHDVGTEDGLPYLVMERVRGPSLRERLRTGPLAPDDALALGLALASALEAAHAAEILHRDVKPANVLYSTEGRAWILADFGIARMPKSNLTRVGQFLGTPTYAAPEALLRGELTAAGDVYAWGATLFAALTGAPPHGEGDLSTVIDSQAKGPPRVPPATRALPALTDLVNAALDPDPARRPTARALREALSTRRDARASTPSAPRVPWIPLGTLALGAVAGIALGLAIGGDDAAPVQPGTVQPSTVQPSTVQPSTVQPGTVQPGTVQPGTVQRGTVQPSTVQPPATPEPPPSDEDRLRRWRAIAPLVNSGDYASARPLLRALLARYPDDEAAHELLDRIDAYDPLE